MTKSPQETNCVNTKYDRYGGWTRLKGRRTGFFHTEQIDGRWWLVSPEGHAFLSKGVCYINWHPERPGSPPVPPADPAAWARLTARQLRGWNFNTSGSWSEPEFANAEFVYTPGLELVASAVPDLWLKAKTFDVFSEQMRQTVDETARRKIAGHADDPWLLGYFTDNELRWDATGQVNESLLESYLKLPAESAGRQQAESFLAARGRALPNATAQDTDDFLELVSAQYGKLTHEAIRRYDANHMIIGCRFGGHAPDPVLRGVGRYFDVISFNRYSQDAPLDKLRHLADVTGKPTMVTEFSFKAMDSGLPNTKGAGEAVATQKDRADGFERYVTGLMTLPSCVGYHWFQYRDQPQEGRALDGENSNYGLATIDGRPWETLTDHMRDINGRIEEIRTRKCTSSAKVVVLGPEVK